MNRRMQRRELLGLLTALPALAWAGAPGSGDLEPAQAFNPATVPALDAEQSRRFRAWFVRIVHEQLRQGPSPRWHQRDCAGLVRFAANEALRVHDAAWLRAMRMDASALPPELSISPQQRLLARHWAQGDGSHGPFVTAARMIAFNSRPLARELRQAEPADLLFYDQGDDQHLMIWTGRGIAYHTGSSSPQDDGLRSLRLTELMQWKDTRWLPEPHNPNFVGLFRLHWLAA